MFERVEAKILEHREVAPRHYRMKVEAPTIANRARAGHYVHVLTRADDATDPFLRRAFSILATDNTSIEFLYRVGGRGTALLARLLAGDSVDLLGPLGQPFHEPTGSSILVGGGVGVPPMAMLANQIQRETPEREVVALLGARRETEIICREDFAMADTTLEIATDDGSAGHHGFVTDLLKQQLTQRLAVDEPAADGLVADAKDIVVYSCGPWGMLRQVARICAEHGVRCQVSLEENMPCGIGVCNGCVVAVNGAGDDYSRYRRVCIDGPPMWADEVQWEAPVSAH